MSGRHEPVLLAETLAVLARGPGLYLDATLGDGGHSEALLEREPDARLLGTDRDPRALAIAGERLARFGDRVTLAHATFREIPEAHRARGGEPFAGALFDLGVSSPQIDEATRGLSFSQEGPLDMRMDPSRGESLADRLGRVDEHEVARVLREYGDVAAPARLARAIVARARAGRLETTRALVETIEQALGGRAHPRRLAPVFQAMRIWINDEMGELEAALEWLPSAMSPDGVVVTIAYHSGEDRRIKHALRGSRVVPSRLPLPAPPELPEGPWEELARKVVRPEPTETERNPRARSARLRAFRRKSR